MWLGSCVFVGLEEVLPVPLAGVLGGRWSSWSAPRPFQQRHRLVSSRHPSLDLPERRLGFDRPPKEPNHVWSGWASSLPALELSNHLFMSHTLAASTLEAAFCRQSVSVAASMLIT